MAGWVARRCPPTAARGPPAAAVAISSDGRWIATPDAVIDATTQRVVASLPTAPRTHALRLQFVDHDARLLVAAATLPERRARAA